MANERSTAKFPLPRNGNILSDPVLGSVVAENHLRKGETNWE